MVDVTHDGDDGRARLLRVVGVGLDQLLQFLVGDHLLEAEELHVEAEAAAQLLRHLVVERLVERGEDAALEQERLDVLRADAGLLGELLDGRALDEPHLLEVGRGGAGRGVERLRDAVFEAQRLRHDEVALEAAPAAAVAGAGPSAGAGSAAAPAAAAGAARVGGRDVRGLRRGGLAGRAVERGVGLVAAARASAAGAGRAAGAARAAGVASVTATRGRGRRGRCDGDVYALAGLDAGLERGVGEAQGSDLSAGGGRGRRGLLCLRCFCQFWLRRRGGFFGRDENFVFDVRLFHLGRRLRLGHISVRGCADAFVGRGGRGRALRGLRLFGARGRRARAHDARGERARPAARGVGRGEVLGLRLGRLGLVRRVEVDLGHGRFRRRGRFRRLVGVLRLLDDADGALDGRLFFREVLVADLLGQLFRDGVRGYGDVNTLAPHLFDEALRLHLQLFGEIVNPDF